MGLLDKLLVSDLVQGTIADGAIEIIDKIQSKAWRSFETKLYKKNPDSSFIWSTISLKENLWSGQSGEMCYYDSSGNKKYTSTITDSKDSVSAVISKDDGTIIWSIYEKKGKTGLVKSQKVINAKDLEVFQFDKKIGTIKTLNEKDACLFFDFLDWYVNKKKDSFQTVAKDGTIVCENYYKQYNIAISCIVYKLSNIEDLLILINTAIFINGLARDRENEMQREIDFKRAYKEFKKDYRKYGGE